MENKNRIVKIEISTKTIFTAIGILIGLWLLVKIREIIILLFVSLILLSALSRPVDWLVAKKIPRLLSVILVYIVIILLIIAVIGIIGPLLVVQTTEFIHRLPVIISTINEFLAFNKIPTQNVTQIVEQQSQRLAGDLVSITTTIVSSFVLVVTIFVLTFYLLLEWKNFLKFIASPFNGKQEKKTLNVISQVEKGLGSWVRGQLTLSLAVGVLSYIGLRIIGIPFALPLALISALLEIVPIIGPIMAAIPAILVGLTISPLSALAAAAVFFLVQQLENHLIVPVIMSRVVGLQPPIVIITLLIGAKLYGIGGAFLAVPFAILLKIIVQEVLMNRTELNEEYSDK